MNPSPGSKFGAYDVIGLLGRGGMGEVYRARDPRLKRDVAIKVMPAEWAQDGQRRMRFQREAELLATLNHPNIGAIYGLEESDGASGLVLELVEGPTLADRLKSGPLPLGDVLRIARQITDALQAAHERGIVHRDLKPENVKVRSDGTVKVLDFGLAKAAGSQASNTSIALGDGDTRSGVLLGTPRYMSPEQLDGPAVDHRTDLWAFGCILFEMLAGRPAFDGTTVASILAGIVGREPAWESLPSSTPPAIDRLVRRCLEKDRGRRIRDVHEVRAALEEATAPSAARSGPARRGVGRTARWIGASAIALAALAAGWAALSSGSGGGVDASLVEVRRLTNYGGFESDGALSPDGRTFAFVSDHGGTTDIWLRQVAGGEPVRLTDDALRELELAFTPDGEWIYFTRTEDETQSIWQIAALGGQPRRFVDRARGAALSPDGSRIAYFLRSVDTSEGETLVVSALDGSDRRELVARVPSFPPPRPAWSNDNRSVSYVSAGLFEPQNLFVVDVATGTQRQLTSYEQSSVGIGQHVWLPGDRYIAAAYIPYTRALSNLDVGVLDTRSGSIQRVTAGSTESFNAPSLARDGSRLIATSTNTIREVWKIPLASDDPVVNGEAGVRIVDASLDPMWTYVSRDGRTLLYAGTATGSRNLWTVPVDGSASPRQITSVPNDLISHSSLSPDGTQVAFVSFEGGSADVWTQNVDGSNPRRLTNDDAAESWPVWSPDGTRIVYTSARAGLSETWVMSSDGSGKEKLIDGFFRGDWIRDPDGEGTLMITSLGGTGPQGVRLLDVEARRVLWEREVPGTGFSMPMFSMDGRRISAPVGTPAGQQGILVLDTATGDARTVAIMPFGAIFRASWVDGDSAFVVNRVRNESHLVLFDRFWQP